MRRDLNAQSVFSDRLNFVHNRCPFAYDQLEGCSTALDWQPRNIGPEVAAGRTPLTTTFFRRQLTVSGQPPGKPEACRTTNGRPRWLSWSPPASEPEVSAAGAAPAWCGHTVERPTRKVQQHSRQTVSRVVSPSDIEKWVAGVQATWNERLDQHLHIIRYMQLTRSRGCRSHYSHLHTASADWRWRRQDSVHDGARLIIARCYC